MTRGTIVVAVVACALLQVPVLAHGAEDPRTEYRAQVEPICAANQAASEGILAGVRARIRRGELRAAGRQFERAAAALRGALSELRRVPSPAADAERLDRWLDRVSQQVDLLRQTGEALIEGQRRRAGKLVTQLSHGARRANALVIVFEFRHCRFEPARYT
jgi:hypothetical protein